MIREIRAILRSEVIKYAESDAGVGEDEVTEGEIESVLSVTIADLRAAKGTSSASQTPSEATSRGARRSR